MYAEPTVASSGNLTNPCVGYMSDSRRTRDGLAGQLAQTRPGEEEAAFLSVLAVCTVYVHTN